MRGGGGGLFAGYYSIHNIFYQMCILSIKPYRMPHSESTAEKMFNSLVVTIRISQRLGWCMFISLCLHQIIYHGYTLYTCTYKLFLFLLMQILYLWVLLASFNILNCVHSQGMSLTLALPYFSATLMKVHIDRVHNAHGLVSSDVGINLGYF